MFVSGKNVKRKVKGISFRLLLVISVFLLAFFILFAIVEEMVMEQENALDFRIFHWLSAYTTPAHTRIMIFITYFGSNYFLLPAYILLVGFYFFFKRSSPLAYNISSVAISSTGLLFLLKDLFKRHRPLDPMIKNVKGFSFPSGHSFSSFTFFGILTYILWNTKIPLVYKWLLSIIFFLCASLIAFSRVYLHVHYASDVMGGFCLSIIWLTLSFWLLHQFNFFNPMAHTP